MAMTYELEVCSNPKPLEVFEPFDQSIGTQGHIYPLK